MTCFLVAFAVLPLVIVAVTPGLDDEAFVSRAEVGSRLAETMSGKLEFLLVDALEGRAPADRFVITVDHGYTAGLTDALGEAFWLEGSLMNRDTFFGEQYLFFGYPQLYVSQVRAGVWWPRQVERLRSLYLAPLSAAASVYLVGAMPFMEEYSPGSYGLVVARFVLLLGAIVAAVWYVRKKRRWTPGVIWAVGAYLLATIGLAVPSL
ncbi:MAG: hypothetical protein JW990_14530 [Thermoleophilia bacterium]|nr:hypothetical protein [Thermoleophilia bacterium]